RAQLLLMKTSDPQMQEALKTIEKAALDGGETVKRIMRYAKGEQSGEEFVSVDMNELLQEVIANTRYHWHNEPEREGKRIHVETDLISLPKCEGNPGELRQFFTNLVINACDAMPDGGRLVISTRSTPTTITVTFEDTGHGMPPEVQSRIFDSFFTTKTGGSLGLGLAMGKQSVQRHGGRIAVDSNLDEGTIFTVTLPRPDQPTEAIEEAQTVPSTTHTQGARILIVESKPALCEVLCESVIALGHQVTGSSSGQQAFRMLNTQHFDVVITDLGMPDIPGSKVAEAAKQISPAPHVILLTGWDNPLDHAQSKYVDEVLTKPVSIARLSAAIETGLVA
ncbi:MAG: hybrid sensor histidine kinase/response regulator, partial [Dehalococcoidia bacterium]|nr:hybrid sensor histidine kinase/response regulator [Dehalococcoidia bacterium]